MSPKPRILLVTGIYPPDIGGPAKYAQNLVETFRKLGHRTEVISFGRFRKFPSGPRHLLFFLKILVPVYRSDLVLILDTFSVALPAVVAARLFGRKTIIRVGGDFLWESYVERIHQPITLPSFYLNFDSLKLNLKERIIEKIIYQLLCWADGLVFNSQWLLDIWKNFYGLKDGRIVVIDNFFDKQEPLQTKNKILLFAGRDLYLKNEPLIDKLKLELKVSHPTFQVVKCRLAHGDFVEKLRSSYAVLIPSLSEVNSNIAAEAISGGTPCVITSYSGLSNQLMVGVRTFDPNNFADFVSQVGAILEEDNYRRLIDQIKRISYRRSWEEISQEYLKFANLL